MKKKMDEIASVQIGCLFSTKITPDPNGNIALIQMKDIDDANTIQTDGLTKINTDRNIERYLVQKNDVLFLSRGRNIKAASINIELTNAVPTSYFYIIRLKRSDVLPGYLAWYINQTTAKKYLESNMKGSNIQMIGKSDFLELPIEIPSIDKQHMIIELEKLLREEHRLLHELASKRKELITASCLKAIENSRK